LVRCPQCSSLDDKVVDSRSVEEGSSIRRRRECLTCHRRFTTYERLDLVPFAVVKRSGLREPFDIAKVVAGLRAAGKNRPLAPEQLESLAGEEGAAKTGSTGIRWVIDPLDGTTNFLFGVPQYSVSIAAEIAGDPVVGVVIDPSHRETWAARRGGGARCNGVPCRVAEGRSTRFGYRQDRRAWQAQVAAGLIPAVRDLRRFGSAALDLCWVAGARVDAYYEWGLNPWDLSAGRVICTEAGGVVDIMEGHTIVATTPSLARPLRDLLVSLGADRPPTGEEPRHW
jgi:myo-inositol-1(or 4)-monophosphatase